METNLPQTIDEMWSRIDCFLSSLPTDQRPKARKVLIRRLMHPEGRRVGLAQAQADLERENKAVRRMPRYDSPMCICGARRSAHDPMTGQTETCEMFTPVAD